ncbi:uroporphyrinogen-III synthase [Pseudoponticoccus marisrubri]|uniref:Tetrapyrrole biosynthesis uroporphyrinogen III synthase domain-containing protein n=1 Tax=Pseudoponticoccus marisrubri TaxID=1685382 RepID=A0A0W7WI40_9RHOB|nr:uroporphyrinogen-III synthase [Pseudoponticoccus marisrubri]KUF10190.1 hypothetical protein AVJ23_14195 [Pseudoponticoccus marisrubri]
MAAPVLLMTRPEPAAREVIAALRARGLDFRAVISPLIGIAVTGPLPDTAGLRGLVITSANGVRAWCALGGPRDLPVFAVGDATARTAREAGMVADSAGGDAAALVARLSAQRPAAPLCHLRGRHARGDVAARLSAAGIETREAVIYDQPEQPLSAEARAALDGDSPVVAPLYSPRTATLMAQMLAARPPKAPLCVAAMSETVAKPLAALHNRSLRIAARPDSDAMLDAVAGLLADGCAH